MEQKFVQSTYAHHQGSMPSKIPKFTNQNPLVAMSVNYIGEFNDVNNDGKYSKSVDGEITQNFQLG